jgi:hypothetical protein
MEYLLVLAFGVFLGAVFFKKDSREKATEAIKHALDKETN